MYKLPVINLKETGTNIERLRKEAGLSVKDIQMVFNFTTPQAIYKWQSGMTLPSMDNMVILAWILGVTIEDILVVEKVSGVKISA